MAEAAPTIEGPAWSQSGLDERRSGLSPLRVEAHVGNMVSALVPGVISTTPHPRTYALHTLVWAEATDQGLERNAAEELLRRAEVTLAGIWLAHPQHCRQVARAHGADEILRRLGASRSLDLTELAQPGIHAAGSRGFSGVYAAAELELGLIEVGWPPKPNPDLDISPFRDALGPILELARRDTLSLDELAACGDLCVCSAAEGADGALMRHVLLERVRSEDAGVADTARITTARLLLEVADGVDGGLQDAFRARLASRITGLEDRVTAQWHGTTLRLYSVAAWRRLWSVIVGRLRDEPCTLPELGDQLAEMLPSGRVGEILDELPRGSDGALLPDAEECLHGDGRPDLLRDLRLINLGAKRVEELTEPAYRAFVGNENEDDLGPAWAREWFAGEASRPMTEFAHELATQLVHRAERVALDKMTIDAAGAYFPTRLRRRAGLYWANSGEGYEEPTLRVGTLGSVLHALGVLSWADGRWGLGDRGFVDA